MIKNLPWHTKTVLALLALLPAYFAIAALGTKAGIWGWQTGLLALTMGGGVILLGIVALAALVSLVIAIRAKPRSNALVGVAIVGLLVPAATFVMFLAAGAKGSENPIHDIATDTANPPAFSAETMAEREAEGANPLSDYQLPLGQLEIYKERRARTRGKEPRADHHRAQRPPCPAAAGRCEQDRRHGRGCSGDGGDGAGGYPQRCRDRHGRGCGGNLLVRVQG
jgi:hypothetical protein